MLFYYASETWMLTKEDENAFSGFERKIFRSIFGAIKDRGQQGKIYKFTSELNELYKESDLVKYLKRNRFRWAGHVGIQKMDENRVVKRVFERFWKLVVLYSVIFLQFYV